jgi:hypothetical protein
MDRVRRRGPSSASQCPPSSPRSSVAAR